jgi:hypothetical protein
MKRLWKIRPKPNTEEISAKIIKFLSKQKGPTRFSIVKEHLHISTYPSRYSLANIRIAVKILSAEEKIEITFKRINNENIFYLAIKMAESGDTTEIDKQKIKAF